MENKQTENKVKPVEVETKKIESTPLAVSNKFGPNKSGARRGSPQGGLNRGPRRPGRGGRDSGRGERAKPEFDQKIIDIRRVTRVVSGGKRFSFSVTIVAGNRKGSVGVGMGKAADTALAINKALRDAKKNMIKLNLTKGMSIPHEVQTKYSSAVVRLMPAKGRGVIAGSSIRNVLELAGVKDVGAKLLSGSKNRINIAKVAIKALSVFTQARSSKVSVNPVK